MRLGEPVERHHSLPVGLETLCGFRIATFHTPPGELLTQPFRLPALLRIGNLDG